MRWKHIFARDFSTESFWPSAAELPPDIPPLDCVDVAVLGHGFAALAAALTLTARGKSVCVASCTPRSVALDETGIGIIGPSLAPFLLKEHVELSIPDAHPTLPPPTNGLFLAAGSPKCFTNLERLQKTQLSCTGDLVPPEEQWRVTGSAYYHGGVTLARAGSADINQWLANIDAEFITAGGHRIDGVLTVESRNSADSWVLHTANARIEARTLVVTTLRGISLPFKVAVVPVRSQILATKPLTPELVYTLFPKSLSVREVSRSGYESRLAPDGRCFMFRVPVKWGNASPKETTLQVYKQMLARWPQLRGIQISHSWQTTAWFRRATAKRPAANVHYCLEGPKDAAGLLELGTKIGNAIDAKIKSPSSRTLPWALRGPAWLQSATGISSRWLDHREHGRGVTG